MGQMEVMALSLSSLAGLAMLTGAGLAGWRGWLQLKRSELEQAGGAAAPGPSAGARIEIADLRERIRKLEAIAAGSGAVSARSPWAVAPARPAESARLVAGWAFTGVVPEAP